MSNFDSTLKSTDDKWELLDSTLKSTDSKWKSTKCTDLNLPFIDKYKRPFKQKKKIQNENYSNFSKLNESGFNKSIKIELKILCDLKENAEIILRLYNEKKEIYEKPAFIEKNVITIIERLAKNWRYDVIKLFREKNSNFGKKKIYTIQAGIATPFHRLVWPNEDICKNLNDETILKAFETFKELLKCGFRLFDFNDTIAKKETFLKCLQYGEDAGHPINLENRLKIYDMFTEKIDMFDDLEKSLGYSLFQATNKNSDFACDKVLYFIHKYPEQVIKKILEWIISGQLSGKNNQNVTGMINCVLSDPIFKSDYYHYLLKYDINEIRQNFILTILSNDFNWIESYIDTKNGLAYRQDAYSNLMILYGVLYSHSYQKNLIINKLITFLDYQNEAKIFPIICFIEHSKINLKELDENENKLLKKFTSETVKNSEKMNQVKAIIEISKILNDNDLNFDKLYSMYN